jgi:hypothetical protein
LEHTHRPTLEDYVHRATRLGSSRSLNLRIGISLDNGMLVLIENLDMKASLQHRLIVANPKFHLKWFSELMHCILI